MATQRTAAGDIEVIEDGYSSTRGGARIWIGTMPDGRFVVTSRFQYEIRTKYREKAEKIFKELTRD